MTNSSNHAISAIMRAIEANRLPHALLLKGRNLAALKRAAYQIAGTLLGCEIDSTNQHPDFFVLQAKNRMRQISVDGTRELIRNIQHSPSAGDRKVALVMEVDRMNMESANAFLKTLEEPPLNTSIILTTVKPNALLDTIVSRCLGFWFNEPEAAIEHAEWVKWKSQFIGWLKTLPEVPKERQAISERLMRLYGLMEGFQVSLQILAKERWESEKENLPEHTADEEILAMEVGVSRSIRVQLLAELEQCIRDFAVDTMQNIADTKFSMDEITKRLDECVTELEYMKGLLDVNLGETKMLEVFLLKVLRIWSR